MCRIVGWKLWLHPAPSARFVDYLTCKLFYILISNFCSLAMRGTDECWQPIFSKFFFTFASSLAMLELSEVDIVSTFVARFLRKFLALLDTVLQSTPCQEPTQSRATCTALVL